MLRTRFLTRIAATDPALSRLRLALSVMLSLGLSGGILAAISVFHAMPLAAYGLTFVLSFICTLAVREPSASEQFRTRLHAGWVAVILALLASVLSTKPLLANVTILCVIFGAAYIRRYGSRWFVVGIVGVMAYFIGDFLRPMTAQVGWLIFGASAALAASHLVTTVLLPANPEKDFRRAMRTIDQRIALILHHMVWLTDSAASPDDDIGALRSYLNNLRDILLMAEGFVPQGRSGGLAAKGAASDLVSALFDLQLAVERLVRARHTALPSSSALWKLIDEWGDHIQPTIDSVSRSAGPIDPATQLVLRLRDARIRVTHALGPEPSPAFQRLDDAESDKDSENNVDTVRAAPDQDNTPSRPRIPEALQRPIQITLASSFALGAGMVLSSERWYWAVIAAFVVFNNTRSRADTAMLAFERATGTFGGVLLGTVVATLLQGHMAISGIAIAVLFFLAIYFVQVSFGLMVVFVTIALALLYGLVGMFTPQLLMVRLEETIVGSTAGALVAFTVFPVKTAGGVGKAVVVFLDILEELVRDAGKCVRGEAGARGLEAESRKLDRAYNELAAAARHLSPPWSVETRFGVVRRALLPFVGSVHWGRVLAQSLGTGRSLPLTEISVFDMLAAEITAEIRIARAAGAGLFTHSRSGSGHLTREPALPVAPAIYGDEHPVHALETIRDLMTWLNRRAGASLVRDAHSGQKS